MNLIKQTVTVAIATMPSPHKNKLKSYKEGTQIMFNTENRSTPESTTDTLKWIGKLVLTVAAGIILSRYGVRLPDNFKI